MSDLEALIIEAIREVFAVSDSVEITMSTSITNTFHPDCVDMSELMFTLEELLELDAEDAFVEIHAMDDLTLEALVAIMERELGLD